MNNVYIIENGQQVSVSLISYFSLNSKNYMFFTKNESVQDGLIKMYVADCSGTSDSISDEEWNNLKKAMQNIIMNKFEGSFINYEAPVTINQSKAIALKQENITSIVEAYKNGVKNATNTTNKDLLAESFGEPKVEPIPDAESTPQVESTPEVNKPVEEELVMPKPADNNTPDLISKIPNNQNTLDIEKTPANMEMNATTTEPSQGNSEEVLTINNVTPPNTENTFKVSDEPNIFDQPAITEEAVNENPEIAPSDNVIPNIDIVPNSSDVSSIDSNKQVELNNRKIRLFEELISIYKEENDLLTNTDDLEKTASNLFDNNGSIGNF